MSTNASETQYETIITNSEEDDHGNPNKDFLPSNNHHQDYLQLEYTHVQNNSSETQYETIITNSEEDNHGNPNKNFLLRTVTAEYHRVEI